MTIEEELALIKQNRSPAAPADPAADLPGPDTPTPAMAELSATFQAAIKKPEAAPAIGDADAALGLPPRETGLAPLPDDDAGTWDVMGAAWRAETIRTDAWNYTERLRRDLTEQMWAKLPEDARQRIQDLKWDQQNNWMRFEDLVAEELGRMAQSGPEAAADLAGLPLTRDAFEQTILKQRRAALDEAQAVLDEPGGAVAEFVGAGARAMTDATSLMLLPIGLSGSAFRVIAGEAVLGAVGEAAVLPREFQVAQELGEPAPDALARIGLGAVLGGGLAGAVVGGGRLIQHIRNRKSAVRAAAPEGVDELDAEAAVDAAEAQMRGDETVAEVIGRRAPAPGTLGDIVQGTRATVVVSPGATRRLAIDATLEARLSEAVGETFGPGYRVQVYSPGQPSIADLRAQGIPESEWSKYRTGSTRHDHGRAADVRIFGPDGRQLTGDALAPVIQYWLARGFGGVGAEMNGGGLHLDLHTDRARTWDYADQGGRLTAAQKAAMAAGQRGEMPRLGGQIGAPTTGRLPNTPGLSYNEDATVSAIIGGESSFDPNARNARSSAGGLGQILDDTWMQLIRRYRPDAIAGLTDSQILDLKFDAGLNREMTAAYARENHAALKKAGLQAGPGEIYLAHFLGPTGAIRVLSASPETPIADLMTAKQIADNKGVRWGGRALAEFRVYDLVQWSRNKMRRAYGDLGPAGAPNFTSSRGYTGAGQVRVSDTMTIDVAYEVVDLSALSRASGDYQPRDRSRINSADWIASRAAQLDPAQLMPSPNAATGAPIVGPDGMIESGNGRYGLIERAYERHPDRIAAYRSAIEAAGFAVPEGVERPILIARRQTELTDPQRVQMTIDAQDSGVAELTPTEKAMAFSRAMDGPRLALYNPALGMGDEGNGGFVRAMLAALPPSARNAMVTPKGGLNRNGQQILTEALFARAWDDPQLVELFLEANPEDMKGLLDALAKSTPEWAALKADIAAGAVRQEFDISGHVLDAMRLISAARELARKDSIPINKALNDLLDQPDLMTGPVAPLTTALVRKFWVNGRAAPSDKVADFLTRYAADARKAGVPGDIFGDAPTPRDVLQAIDRDTFADLPEDLGQARAPQPIAAEATPDLPDIEDVTFDAGAQGQEAEDLAATIRAEIEGPEPDAPAPDAAELRAARDDLSLFQDVEIDLGDGTKVRARDILDDLDADAAADAVLQACGIGGDA